MSIDPADQTVESRAAPSGRPRPWMIIGVAAACGLGAMLGLWARPSDVERELSARHQPRPVHPVRVAAPRQIEIRVDRPAPAAAVAAPVAAQVVTAKPVAEPPPALVEPMAPQRPPEGLMRVHAVAPLRLEDRPLSPSAAQIAAARAAAKRQAEAEARAEALEQRRAEAAEAESRARAKAKAAERKAEKLEKARLAAAKAQDAVRRKAAAKALAQAQAEARELKKKLAAQQARAQAVKLADAKAAARVQAERKRAERERAAPRGGGPLRQAKARCITGDPGAAMACTDPGIATAERQLSRAYREAQAAGVPASTLERQQQRWLSARAAAAREAPWAVRDVYVARIAELQDQARQAGRGE